METCPNCKIPLRGPKLDLSDVPYCGGCGYGAALDGPALPPRLQPPTPLKLTLLWLGALIVLGLLGVAGAWILTLFPGRHAKVLPWIVGAILLYLVAANVFDTGYWDTGQAENPFAHIRETSFERNERFRHRGVVAFLPGKIVGRAIVGTYRFLKGPR
tara:strand:+ start:23 stop:496 length:474 start_codon:yes stop_codon:yes gene_type:complete